MDREAQRGEQPCISPSGFLCPHVASSSHLCGAFLPTYVASHGSHPPWLGYQKLEIFLVELFSQ